MRKGEDANRTREGGNLDEIEGVVTKTLTTHRNGTVGSSDWLGVFMLRLKPSGNHHLCKQARVVLGSVLKILVNLAEGKTKALPALVENEGRRDALAKLIENRWIDVSRTFVVEPMPILGEAVPANNLAEVSASAEANPVPNVFNAGLLPHGVQIGVDVVEALNREIEQVAAQQLFPRHWLGR